MNLQAAQNPIHPGVLLALQEKNRLAGGFVSKFIKHLEEIEKMTICPIAKKVFFNERKLDLYKKDKLFMIFYQLYNNKKEGLSREELIEKIYQVKLSDTSVRQRICYQHNIIKLISRARKIAIENLSNKDVLLEWFPHSTRSKKWFLCRPDIKMITEYLIQKVPEEGQERLLQRSQS